LQVPPKFTRIGIFGTKICHLATLDVVTAAAKFFSKKVVLQKKVSATNGCLADWRLTNNNDGCCVACLKLVSRIICPNYVTVGRFPKDSLPFRGNRDS
jgi:hypothetical protein